jgi:hypothetical protein
MDTVAPLEIDVVLRFKSWPDVPTVPCTTAAFAEVSRRKNVAVPVAAAVALLIAFAVSTPPDGAGANVALHALSDNIVLLDKAAFALAGGVPS